MTETRVQNSLAGFPERMVLLDCETTGGKATRDRMTEVALIRVERGEVVQRWQTLLNPGMSIPPWITRLTGIENGMVRDAPTFEDIAAELEHLLDGAVLVAHNARFDYGFLKNEFRRAGIDYSTRPLCSVKLSRKLYPNVKGHGLDALIRRFGLQMDDRHRAMADTDAIWQFFQRVDAEFEEDEIRAVCSALLQRASLPSQLAEEEVDKLPATPGVYRFHAGNGHLLYVGKSVSIRDRVMSHFAGDHANRKGLEMCQHIEHIDFTATPSDFGAQLLENHQIKTLSPQYNRRQTRVQKLFQFEVTTPEDGYPRLELVQADPERVEAITSRFGLFRTRRQANLTLKKLADIYGLCHRFTGLENKQAGACFAHQLHRCAGACCGEEPVEVYRLRVESAMATLKNQVWPYSGPIVVCERAKQDDNDQYHLIDQWLYFGSVRDNAEMEALLEGEGKPFFDLDTYHILIRFLLNPQLMTQNRLSVVTLPEEAEKKRRR